MKTLGFFYFLYKPQQCPKNLQTYEDVLKKYQFNGVFSSILTLHRKEKELSINALPILCFLMAFLWCPKILV